MLSLESALNGYDINYTFCCEYYDIEGEQQNCDLAVEDYANTNVTKFLIEFVTSQKIIYWNFQVGPFFIMFDSQGYVDFLTFYFYADSDNSHAIDLDCTTLTLISQVVEEEVFGCSLKEYIDIDIIYFDVEESYYTAIMTYQCDLEGKPSFNMSLINITSE